MTEEDITKIVKNIEASKDAGIGKLPGRFLRDGADVLAKPVCQLCNLPVRLNTFLEDCKIAKLKPPFKQGSKTNPANYRLISLLLSKLSKVIERIVHEQTTNFF